MMHKVEQKLVKSCHYTDVCTDSTLSTFIMDANLFGVFSKTFGSTAAERKSESTQGEAHADRGKPGA